MIELKNKKYKFPFHSAQLISEIKLSFKKNKKKYELSFQGLTEKDFNFNVDSEIVEHEGKFDYQKALDWTFNQLLGIDQIIVFSNKFRTIFFELKEKNNQNLIIAIKGIFGIKLYTSIGGNLEIQVQGLLENDFNVQLENDQIYQDVDIGDVFRFLMNMLKKFLCPQCL